MQIRQTTEADLADIIDIHKRAFGERQGDEVSQLTDDMLHDPTALPRLSLLAIDQDQPIGHVLFTKVTIAGIDQPPMSILAPLAVVPQEHSKGVGGKLVREGLRLLAEEGVRLVFVLGHPGYYPRHGFTPAGVHGLHAPYPIPEIHAGAWMVQELADANGEKAGWLGKVKGTIEIAKTLDEPQHWRE